MNRLRIYIKQGHAIPEKEKKQACSHMHVYIKTNVHLVQQKREKRE